MSQDPRALLQKAAKEESKAGSGFGFFGAKKDKLLAAADSYITAANAFRMANQNEEAGKAFEEAARIQIAQDEADDAANTYQDAFKVYRKDNPEAAVRCLNFAVDRYNSKGNVRRAATQKQNVAELLEAMADGAGDPASAKRYRESSLKDYETAASWFETDNAEALANKLWLKVADVAALEEDYYKAIQNYEKVAKSSVSNNLMKWSVKDYFLKAGLCHLASGDMVATNRAFEQYRDMDMTFASTREHQLLVDLAEAVAAGDQEVFADKLFQYDQMSKLDKWKTTILLKIKNAIEEVGEDFS